MLLTDVANVVFTEEIVPQAFVDETTAVFSCFMAVAPVVRLSGFPVSANKQQGAVTPQLSTASETHKKEKAAGIFHP